MRNTIPTAEEFLNDKFKAIYHRRPDVFKSKLPEHRFLDLWVSSRIDGKEQNYPEMMVEFTKIHVAAALEAASQIVGLNEGTDFGLKDEYPLENIK